mmetsp:Transcript_97592/g.304371  ORF Transcript_97592/g.304371 Transcript_97592/m.304371 type:complete len:204 (+) Transcript_97592:399-1010(+)
MARRRRPQHCAARLQSGVERHSAGAMRIPRRTELCEPRLPKSLHLCEFRSRRRRRTASSARHPILGSWPWLLRWQRHESPAAAHRAAHATRRVRRSAPRAAADEVPRPALQCPLAPGSWPQEVLAGEVGDQHLLARPQRPRGNDPHDARGLRPEGGVRRAGVVRTGHEAADGNAAPREQHSIGPKGAQERLGDAATPSLGCSA